MRKDVEYWLSRLAAAPLTADLRGVEAGVQARIARRAEKGRSVLPLRWHAAQAIGALAIGILVGILAQPIAPTTAAHPMFEDALDMPHEWIDVGDAP